MPVSRRFLLLSALALPLAACGTEYATDFAALPPEMTAQWHVRDVVVDAPDSLTVSEAPVLVPVADIVWREDDRSGDRHAQVEVILRQAIAWAASGLRGPRAVILLVKVKRFHALTFEAETQLQHSGVHNIHFDIWAVDARTGEVLVGPELIEADVPALSGPAMKDARARGETQKSQIQAHVMAAVAAWLGIGPDVRGSFTRLGD
jgi:hypothetical protein